MGEAVIELAKVAVAALAAMSTLLGVAWQWRQAHVARSNSALFEARQPFLTRQLELYSEAAKVVAKIATSRDEGERDSHEDRFWELYWGELALVEDRGVESAMVAFGKALKSGENQARLQPLSLDLAHAIRRSLDRSWGIEVWTKAS
jgi:hypothetical protein